jgi:hypothetical protein
MEIEMFDWRPIETAPTDGTLVEAGTTSHWLGVIVLHPLTSRFIEGKWTAECNKEWCPYDPQPTHWRPLKQTLPKLRHEIALIWEELKDD